jgi:hypothetical protein
MSKTEIKFKELAPEKHSEMIKWCRENFGGEALWSSQLDNARNAPKWYTRGNFPKGMFGAPAETGSALFVFNEGKDATFFSLRWSDVNKTRQETV